MKQTNTCAVLSLSRVARNWTQLKSSQITRFPFNSLLKLRTEKSPKLRIAGPDSPHKRSTIRIVLSCSDAIPIEIIWWTLAPIIEIKIGRSPVCKSVRWIWHKVTKLIYDLLKRKLSYRAEHTAINVFCHPTMMQYIKWRHSSPWSFHNVSISSTKHTFIISVFVWLIHNENSTTGSICSIKIGCIIKYIHHPITYYC